MATSNTKWDAVFVLAQKRGVTLAACRKWQARGFVPGKWHLPLLEEAESDGVSLTRDDLLNPTRLNDEAATSSRAA